jgi:hypothetical protein
LTRIQQAQPNELVLVNTGAMVATGSNVTVDVVVTVAVIVGPLLAIGIFWLGLRNARKHDEQQQ